MTGSQADIELATSILKGKPLWRCFRAANMAMFQFGKKIMVRNALTNREDEVGEVALHVQCSWRISGVQVLVGSGDLAYPADYEESGSVPEEFDWDRDANRLDKQVDLFFESGTKEFVVGGVTVGAAGKLSINMDGGLVLDVLPDSSLGFEHWRLFSPGKNARHFVFTGKGIEGDSLAMSDR